MADSPRPGKKPVSFWWNVPAAVFPLLVIIGHMAVRTKFAAMFTEMDGAGTWYFAHKEGILVSDWTEGTADGSITVNSPDGEMVIPVTREYTMLTRLVQ